MYNRMGDPMTVLNAHYDGRQIVLDEPMPADVPPNSPVRVVVGGRSEPSALEKIAAMAEPLDLPPDFSTTQGRVHPAEEPPATQTLADTMSQFIGIGNDMPPDGSRNVDHYLYGAPKK